MGTVIKTTEWGWPQQFDATPPYYMPYKVEVVLNSQDSVTRKSNITVNIYGRRGDYDRGSYPAYESYSSVVMYAKYKIHAADEPQDLITTKHVPSNNYANWTLLGRTDEKMTWTGDVQHDNDGTLTMYIAVGFDHNSTGQYAPVKGEHAYEDFEIPAIGEQKSLLGDMPTGYIGSADEYIDFPYTVGAAADHNGLEIQNLDGDRITYFGTNSSPARFAVANLQNVLPITFKMLGEMGDECTAELVAILTTYASDDTVVGTDTKHFNIVACSMDRNVDGNWKNGALWRNCDGTWKKGVLWRKCGNYWRRCVKIS